MIALQKSPLNAPLAPNSDPGYSRHETSSMTTEDAGKALAEARIARGLTLHDVERDTRIASKYLEALEEGNLGVLPAPVYARAFMRTYAQYLGLNAPALVQRLPGAKPEPELPPLPEVGREARASPISASWLASGAVVLLLLVLGLLLFWNRGDGEERVAGPPQVGEFVGEGAEEPIVTTDQLPPAPVVEPGIVPDLEGQPALSALKALFDADLRYLIIEVESDDVPAEIVFRQSPSPGTTVEQDTVVTLLVSR